VENQKIRHVHLTSVSDYLEQHYLLAIAFQLAINKPMMRGCGGQVRFLDPFSATGDTLLRAKDL